MYGIDLAVFNGLYGLSGHSQWFDWLIVAVAVYLSWFIAVYLAYKIYLAWNEGARDKVVGYALAVASGGIARGVVELIRFYYHHPRPPVVLHITSLFPETTYSFPSGHAVFFFGIAVGVYLFDKKLGRILLVGATLVGVARIMAGVHWPSDILAGALLGGLTAWVLFQIWKWLSRTINLPTVH
jgi:undecaprenyl-diphosphatase